MNKLNFLMIALAAILGFSSCDKHDCNDYEHSADLTGTWTYIGPGYAEALVISADGSVVSTGVEGNEYWEDVNGTIVVKDGKVTMTFEDDDNFEGHFDIIPGVAFSIYTEEGERFIYQYCKEDLSDEIVGMWVCNGGPSDVTGDMAIQTYKNNGKVIVTTSNYHASGSPIINKEDNYTIIGDLLIFNISEENMSVPQYVATRLLYTANGTSLGDIMTQKMYIATENGSVETTSSWLRVNQILNLTGKKYEYSNLYVTNVKGLDREIDFLGFKFNFAKMDGGRLDKMLKTLLFTFEFPDANTIKYSCHYNNLEPASVSAPIAVDGNKMTIKMSETYPAVKDVDFYAFQDVDGCQMHIYMPSYSVVNFFANMQITMMSQMQKLDLTDAAAVKAVYDSIDEAVETINISIVMGNR